MVQTPKLPSQIIEFAKTHPELYKYFSARVKTFLRKEFATANVPKELRAHHGRKPKREQSIYERVMHDQPIIAPMPEARVVIERLPPIRHNVENLARRPRELATEYALHHAQLTEPEQRVRLVGPILPPIRARQ